MQYVPFDSEIPAGGPEVDETEAIRRQMLAEQKLEEGSREALEAKYGQVWDTTQMSVDFDVIGFMAPLIVVIRKADRKKGSLTFRHSPRFYFDFVPHDRD